MPPPRRTVPQADDRVRSDRGAHKNGRSAMSDSRVDEYAASLHRWHDEFAALRTFFKGALLNDPKGLLREQGEESRSSLRLEFRSVADVTRMKSAIRDLSPTPFAYKRPGYAWRSLRPRPTATTPTSWRRSWRQTLPFATPSSD